MDNKWNDIVLTLLKLKEAGVDEDVLLNLEKVKELNA